MSRRSPLLAVVGLALAAASAALALPLPPLGLPVSTTTVTTTTEVPTTTDTTTSTTATTTAPRPPTTTTGTVATTTSVTVTTTPTTTAPPPTSTTTAPRPPTTTTAPRPTLTTTTRAPATSTTTSLPAFPVPTTTTLPRRPEVCGNCADDDRNGLYDFEDPACCAGGSAVMTLKRARLVRRRSLLSSLRVDATVASPTGIDPLVQDVFVTIRPAGRPPLFCARLPADAFDAAGRAVLFRDRRHAVASAVGIDRLRAVVRPDGTMALHVEGRRMSFVPPPERRLTVTLGFRFPTTAEQTNHCTTATAVLRANARGTRLVFP
ncbi:MAG TPA: hypothetical protein VFD84_04370 [Candidatus Binatia bacterium]|nr:hypothetical protein [Candidatus Binatia bacterium]